MRVIVHTGEGRAFQTGVDVAEIASDMLGPGRLSLLPRGSSSLSIRPRTDFDFDEVLNHRIESFSCASGAETMCEGWLLAMGYKPIPDEVRTRQAGAA